MSDSIDAHLQLQTTRQIHLDPASRSSLIPSQPPVGALQYLFFFSLTGLASLHVCSFACSSSVLCVRGSQTSSSSGSDSSAVCNQIVVSASCFARIAISSTTRGSSDPGVIQSRERFHRIPQNVHFSSLAQFLRIWLSAASNHA